MKLRVLSMPFEFSTAKNENTVHAYKETIEKATRSIHSLLLSPSFDKGGIEASI